MVLGKRISDEIRKQMVSAYIADDSATYHSIAKQFGVSFESARRIITNELQSVPGVKPNRNNRKPSDTCAADKALDRKHAEVMAKLEHPRTSDWMQHITPLHQQKQMLEQVIEHKQAELDRARQEYRDFLATLEQLVKEEV